MRLGVYVAAERSFRSRKRLSKQRSKFNRMVSIRSSEDPGRRRTDPQCLQVASARVDKQFL
jgi:hypothetical protein